MRTFKTHFAFVMVFFAHVVFCYPADTSSRSTDELTFVHIIYRHGDRTITKSYPNDPFKDENQYWPEGFGQLTNIGKLQEYELGAYLRKRYKHLLGKDGHYDRNNIYVRSTDVDRTLMSAEYSLAGMFPPNEKEIWNEALLWQAIPVHTVPEQIDHVLAMKRSCHLYMDEYKKYLNSSEVQSIFKDNHELIEYLKLHTGQDFTTVFALKEFHEILSIENAKNFTLPEWTKKVFPGGKLYEWSRFSYLMDVKTKLMARLKVGFLLQEILKRFTMKTNGLLQPNRSIWIYAAHDATIVQLLGALNLFNLESPELPDYASCLFLELHKSNGTFHVEIIYKSYHGEDKGPLEPLFIPNCGVKCPLDKFYEIYQDIIPTKDFDTECANSASSSHISLIALVVGLAAYVILK